MKKHKKLTAHRAKSQPDQVPKEETPTQAPSKAKTQSWVDKVDWFGEKRS